MEKIKVQNNTARDRIPILVNSNLASIYAGDNRIKNRFLTNLQIHKEVNDNE